MFARRGQQAGSVEAGFTLLEVLVALAIAVPALVLLYRQGAVAMGAAWAATTYQEAISRVQSRLDALTGTGLAAGEEEGDDGGFRWRTRIALVASAPSSGSARRRTGVAGASWFGKACLDDGSAARLAVEHLERL